MMKLKLSELSDEIELTIEESSFTYTVAELKHEITELGEPHHLSSNWYTINRKRWNPNASTMIERYIDNEFEDMYEDWDVRAMECLHDTVIENLQTIVDEAFESNYATEYWTCDKPVEIDVFPVKVN